MPPPPEHRNLTYRSHVEKGNEANWPVRLETWQKEYQPDSPSFEQHVLRAAQVDLILGQEERRYDAINTQWIADDQNVELLKRVKEMSRRLEQAERAALRWAGFVERIRRSRFLDNLRAQRQMDAKKHSPPMKNSPSKPSPLVGVVAPKPPATPVSALPYLQVVDVKFVDGVAVTNYNPPNRNMVAMLRQLGRLNQTVRRTIHFPETLPPEYAWVLSKDGRSPSKLEWCFSEADFTALAAREQEAGTGHVIESEHDPIREVLLFG